MDYDKHGLSGNVCTRRLNIFDFRLDETGSLQANTISFRRNIRLHPVDVRHRKVPRMLAPGWWRDFGPCGLKINRAGAGATRRLIWFNIALRLRAANITTIPENWSKHECVTYCRGRCGKAWRGARLCRNANRSKYRSSFQIEQIGRPVFVLRGRTVQKTIEDRG